MGSKIKILLQYPWRFSEGTYYKFLIKCPPRNAEFLKSKKESGVISKSGLFRFSKNLKKIIKNFLKAFNTSLINARSSPEENYDLIHCAHCLSKNKSKPWVADMEGVFQFYVGKKTKSSRKKILRLLKRDNCKKIIPWTKEAEETIKKEFPGAKSKIECVYPAIPFPKRKNKEHKGINLLFVGRYFYGKGGLHTLETMDMLTKKYKDVNCVFLSDVPSKIKKKYSKNKKIKIYSLIPQKKLFEEIYPKTDIIIYPGYTDSFGFAFLEAMSFGLPIITVDGFARKEIIEDGKTGFVIDFPRGFKMHEFGYSEKGLGKEEVVKKIFKKASELIKNRKLREKMSKNCINEIKKGKFSIKRRNEKLSKIYSSAVR